MAERSYLSIGQVLDLLKREFPDLTISKIRFLESQGLLDPERTPSGYRKFYEPDIDRLRFILRAQSEHYLPLKVIKGRLGGEGDEADFDADSARTPPVALAESIEVTTTEIATARLEIVGDNGRWGAAASAPSPVAGAAAGAGVGTGGLGLGAAGAVPSPDAVSSTVSSTVSSPVGEGAGGDDALGAGRLPDESVSMTLDELATASGLSSAEVTELERFGLVAGRRIAGTVYYDSDCLEIASVAAGFRRFGVEARHLRMYKTAVEREAGFFEQVVTPMLKQRNPQARRQAVETLHQLSRLGNQLRAAALRQALREYTGGS